MCGGDAAICQITFTTCYYYIFKTAIFTYHFSDRSRTVDNRSVTCERTVKFERGHLRLDRLIFRVLFHLDCLTFEDQDHRSQFAVTRWKMFLFGY